jgi:hypothetical protein
MVIITNFKPHRHVIKVEHGNTISKTITHFQILVKTILVHPVHRHHRPQMQLSSPLPQLGLE